MRRVLMCAALPRCCSPGAAPTQSQLHRTPQIKAAYYRASDESELARTLVEDAWADPDAHAHTNYVPQDGIETCPQAQRANANAAVDGNSVRPSAGTPVNQFVVAPEGPGRRAHPVDHPGRARLRDERRSPATG